MNSREHVPKIGIPLCSSSNSTRSSVSTWLTRNFMVWWMLWTLSVKCLLVGECYIYIHGWVGSTCGKSTPFSQGHCWRNLGWEQTSWCRSGTNTKVLHTGVTSFVSHWPFVSLSVWCRGPPCYFVSFIRNPIQSSAASSSIVSEPLQDGALLHQVLW
jgi:hypothetical protein